MGEAICMDFHCWVFGKIDAGTPSKLFEKNRGSLEGLIIGIEQEQPLSLLQQWPNERIKPQLYCAANLSSNS